MENEVIRALTDCGPCYGYDTLAEFIAIRAGQYFTDEELPREQFFKLHGSGYYRQRYTESLYQSVVRAVKSLTRKNVLICRRLSVEIGRSKPIIALHAPGFEQTSRIFGLPAGASEIESQTRKRKKAAHGGPEQGVHSMYTDSGMQSTAAKGTR